jgi:hypothetical protein
LCPASSPTPTADPRGTGVNLASSTPTADPRGTGVNLASSTPTADPRGTGVNLASPTPTADPRGTPTPNSTPTTLLLTMAGSLGDFTPTVLDSIKSSLATAAGISASLVSVEVQSGTRRRSVVLKATMPSGAATSVMAQIQSGTLKQLGGLTVEGVAVGTVSTSAPVSTTQPQTTDPALPIASPTADPRGTPFPTTEAPSTYDWVVGSWGDCVASSCPSFYGFQTRTVYCQKFISGVGIVQLSKQQNDPLCVQARPGTLQRCMTSCVDTTSPPTVMLTSPPTAIPTTCEDTDVQCPLFAAASKCADDWAYMSTACRSTCGLCPGQTRYPTNSPTMYPTPSPTTPSPSFEAISWQTSSPASRSCKMTLCFQGSRSAVAPRQRSIISTVQLNVARFAITAMHLRGGRASATVA